MRPPITMQHFFVKVLVGRNKRMQVSTSHNAASDQKDRLFVQIKTPTQLLRIISSPFSALSLEIAGRHALLFEDESTAVFISSQDAILPWIGDPNLVIDRFDARILLRDLTVLCRKKCAATSPAFDLSDGTQEELNVERYRDLLSTDDGQVSVERRISQVSILKPPIVMHQIFAKGLDGRTKCM